MTAPGSNETPKSRTKAIAKQLPQPPTTQRADRQVSIDHAKNPQPAPISAPRTKAGGARTGRNEPRTLKRNEYQAASEKENAVHTNIAKNEPTRYTGMSAGAEPRPPPPALRNAMRGPSSRNRRSALPEKAIENGSLVAASSVTTQFGFDGTGFHAAPTVKLAPQVGHSSAPARKVDAQFGQYTAVGLTAKLRGAPLAARPLERKVSCVPIHGLAV